MSSQAEREKVVLAIGNSEGVAEVDDQLAVPQPEPQAKFYTARSTRWSSRGTTGDEHGADYSGGRAVNALLVRVGATSRC